MWSFRFESNGFHVDSSYRKKGTTDNKKRQCYGPYKEAEEKLILVVAGNQRCNPQYNAFKLERISSYCHPGYVSHCRLTIRKANNQFTILLKRSTSKNMKSTRSIRPIPKKRQLNQWYEVKNSLRKFLKIKKKCSEDEVMWKYIRTQSGKWPIATSQGSGISRLVGKWSERTFFFPSCSKNFFPECLPLCSVSRVLLFVLWCFFLTNLSVQ